MVPIRTLRRTSSSGSASSAATAAANSSASGSARRIAVQRSSVRSMRILGSGVAASSWRCCAFLQRRGIRVRDHPVPARHAARFLQSRSRLLLGRGDDWRTPSPTIVGAHPPQSTPDEPTLSARRGLISNHAAEPARRITHTDDSHHQAPAGQPGFGVGLVATLAVAESPAATLARSRRTVGADSVVLQRLREGHRCRSRSDVPPRATMFNVTRDAGKTGDQGCVGSLVCHGRDQRTAFAFTRLGGYNGTFPTNGYTTSVDVYLDMAQNSVVGTDLRFDWTSAVSNATGGYGRDFVFNAGTNPAVAGSSWSAPATMPTGRRGPRSPIRSRSRRVVGTRSSTASATTVARSRLT